MRERVAAIPPVKRAHSLIIYTLLDEKMYMARSAEGGQNPCRPPKKGIIHVEGKLVLAESSWIKDILASFAPILNAGTPVEGILMTPLPRYLEGPCCARSTHMPGYEKTQHTSSLLSQLHHSRRAIKDIMASKGIKNVRAANMAKLVADSGSGWADASTPNIGTYQELVAAIIAEIPGRLGEKAISMMSGKNKRPREGDDGGPTQKKYGGWGNNPSGGSEHMGGGSQLGYIDRGGHRGRRGPGGGHAGHYNRGGRGGHRGHGGRGGRPRGHGGQPWAYKQSPYFY